jgi:hypothetical protein
MAQGPTQWDLREGVKWQSQLLTTVTEIAKCAGHEKGGQLFEKAYRRR